LLHEIHAERSPCAAADGCHGGNGDRGIRGRSGAEDQAAAPSDGEIVVTAQFRQESAQKAAVSIDVLSAETLARAGVAQATDLARLSPGVQITQGGSSLQIYIRGAGDFSTTAYSNSAVAQNYDGVFAARSQYVAGVFYDLERVEVLKGPQGTLYGRNATGGALNILPVQPKLGVFEGYVGRFPELQRLLGRRRAEHPTGRQGRHPRGVPGCFAQRLYQRRHR
jgi:outer membrane receptor protein involved in Fe transport